MATKEIKTLLKSARSALDRQEYDEAIKHCEVSQQQCTTVLFFFTMHNAQTRSAMHLNTTKLIIIIIIIYIIYIQAVLWSDSSNYLANVIAGKAHLLLGRKGDAKRHYKQAVAINDKELLAWKVGGRGQRRG